MSQENVNQNSALTTAEFTSRFFNSSRKLAVFDCDGTLWSGDAGAGFFEWELEPRPGLP